MSSLILMYLYYDKNGDIKAITPAPEKSLETFSFAMFPINEVEDFLKGKKRPFDYTISKVKKIAGETFKILRKQSNVVMTRTLDNYLTKVEPFNHNESIIKIIVDNKLSSIKIKLDPAYKDLYFSGTDEQKEDIEYFINSGKSCLYFTKENNPYFLLHTIEFTPRQLFNEDEICHSFDENLDLSTCSVYTKKIVSSYGYLIKNKS